MTSTSTESQQTEATDSRVYRVEPVDYVNNYLEHGWKVERIFTTQYIEDHSWQDYRYEDNRTYNPDTINRTTPMVLTKALALIYRDEGTEVAELQERLRLVETDVERLRTDKTEWIRKEAKLDAEIGKLKQERSEARKEHELMKAKWDDENRTVKRLECSMATIRDAIGSMAYDDILNA